MISSRNTNRVGPHGATNDAPNNHYEALSYVTSVIAPTLLATNIPDTNTTPCVRKTHSMRHQIYCPQAEWAVVPKFHSNKPRLELLVKSNAASTNVPANTFIRNSILLPDEQLAANYTKARLVSAHTNITNLVVSSGASDIQGRITAAEVDGLPPTRDLSLTSLSRYAISPLYDAPINYGVNLIQRPHITDFKRLIGLGAPFLSDGSMGKFGQQQDFAPDPSPVEYSYDTFSNLNGVFENRNAIGSGYVCTLQNNSFPRNLSAQVEIAVYVSLAQFIGPANSEVEFRLIGHYATINTGGTVTETTGTLIRQNVHADGLTTFTAFTGIFRSHENDGDFPDGQLVALSFVASGQTSFSNGGRARIIVRDLNPSENEEVSNVAICSGWTPNSPIQVVSTLNYEAVPDELMRAQLKPSATFVGTEYLERCMNTLIGPGGVYQPHLSNEAYLKLVEQLTQGGAAARTVGTAYAMSWGSLWNFVKPGLNAMVPGVAHLIASIIGDKFEKPLTELGRTAFSAPARMGYCSDAQTSEPSKEAADVKCNCETKVRSLTGCTVSRKPGTKTAYCSGPVGDVEAELDEALGTVDTKPERPVVSITRGTPTVASFRAVVPKSMGPTREMADHLTANGSEIPVVMALSPEPETEIQYGKVLVTTKPLMPLSEYVKVYEAPQLTVQMDNTYTSQDNLEVLNSVITNGFLHPVYAQAATLYVTLAQSGDFSNVTGNSHGAALFLALGGYSTDAVVSSGIVFENGRPVLTPVGSVLAKARFCIANQLRFITTPNAANAYKPSNSPSKVTQFDLDRGFTNHGDGSLFSARKAYFVSEVASLTSLLRDPRLLKGTTEPPKEVKISQGVAETGQPVRVEFSLGDQKWSFDITDQASVDDMVERLRPIAPNVLRSFAPTLSNVIGITPWNTKEGRPAEPGETKNDGVVNRLAVRPKFLTSIQQLDKQIQDSRNRTKKTKAPKPTGESFNIDELI